MRQYSSPADLLAAEQAAAVSEPSHQASVASPHPSRANLLSVNRAASCLVPGAGLDEPPLPMPGETHGSWGWVVGLACALCLAPRA